MGTPRLLGPDQATLLFDFDAPTGTGNPNTLITSLAAGWDVGTVQPALRTSMLEAGAELDGIEFPPVEMSMAVNAAAATAADLWAGVGQLARYLIHASRDHPLFLEWTELGTTYYYDIIGALELPQLFRGSADQGISVARKRSMGPIPIRLLRQPWRRGATITTSSDTVEDDPATGTPDGSRTYAITVAGDLPTPGKIRAQMDTGSTVAHMLCGYRARKARPSSYLADLLTDTGWFQCEATNRGWTITLGTDTTATTDAAASPVSGNTVAQVASAGGSVGVMTRRVRATRTTLLDSLRGSWVPTVRMACTGSPYEWEVILKWGPSTADPVAFAEAPVKFAATATGGVYEEPIMGRIDLPLNVALSGLAIEIWARRVSGTGALNIDLCDLWPADGLASVIVPAAAPTVTNGEDLTSPPDQITGDAVWTAGTDGVGALTFISLTDDLDAAGLGPNTGTVYPAGRHRFTFDLESPALGPNVAEARITNVTDNVEVASRPLSVIDTGRYTVVLELDADGADAYQAQVTATDLEPGSMLRVHSITHQFMPSLLINESIRTDPARYAVDRLDSSGNLSGYLEIQGVVPVMLEPGDGHIKLRADEIPFLNHTAYENDITRDLTVTVEYGPRFAA